MDTFSLFFRKKSRVSGFLFLHFSLFSFHFSLNLPRDFSREERKEKVAFLPLVEKHWFLFESMIWYFYSAVINCWTVDDKTAKENLAGLGVDYITTNILE